MAAVITIRQSEGWPQTVEEFGRLVDATQNELVHFAFYRMGNRADAEDVVQDVYVQAFRDRTLRRHVTEVRQQFQERRTLEPQTHLCGRKTLLTSRRKKRLQQLLSNRPDATLKELGEQMDRPFRTSTVDLWLRKMGLTYKKNAPRFRTRSS